jgi:Glycosyltransferase family 87
VTLLVAAAIAAATSYVTIFTPANVTVVVAGCLLLGAVVALRAALRLPTRVAVCAALLVGLVPQWWRPPSGNVTRGPLFHLATALGMLASVLLGAAVLGPARRRRPLALLAFASAAAAGAVVIQSSARPAIDVWVIFQQASHGLLHGRNPYEMLFAGVPPGQTGDCFNYLPFTFLVAVPGRVVLGDVRYAELGVLLAGAAMLVWALRRRGRQLALPLAVMAVSLPGVLRVVQQGWNESIVLGCLLAAVALLVAGRAWLAAVPLGLALATKQHVLLLLPLWALWPGFGWRRALAAGGLGAAVCLPWLLADPGRFYGCTVRFFIDLPARQDSLSVWKFVPGPARSGVVVALVAAGYLLARRFVERTPAVLVLACGLEFAAFDVANKQTFENQWLLVCQLLVVALACKAAEERPQQAKAKAARSDPAGRTVVSW